MSGWTARLGSLGEQLCSGLPAKVPTGLLLMPTQWGTMSIKALPPFSERYTMPRQGSCR